MTTAFASNSSLWLFGAWDPEYVLYNQGSMYKYHVPTEVASLALNTGSYGTARTYAADSVVHYQTGDARWLEWTLTDISAVLVGTQQFQIYGFYSDSTAWQSSNTGTATTGNLSLGSGYDVSATNYKIDAATFKDTTWFVDGTNLGFWTDDSTLSVSYPAYSDTGTIDSIIMASNGSWDSLLICANFDSSHGDPYHASRRWRDYVILIGDTMHQNGIPFEPRSLVDNGLGTERLLVYADSSRWGAYTTDSIWGENARYILAYGDDMPRELTRTVVGDLDYVGDHGNVSHYIFHPDDNSWIATARDWDCRVMRGKSGSALYYYARIVRRNDSLQVWMWYPATGGYQADTTSVTFYFDQHKPFHVATDVSTANEYSIIELHRQRAFYAGSATTPQKFTWSYQGHIDSVNTSGEVLEGDDPIIGLSSLGQEMVIYRRHSMLSLTGFSIDDFYLTPIPSGVGAASNLSIARNPEDNADYFVNEEGLWSYGGGGVQKINTRADEIFQDSINWTLEYMLQAAVYNGRYWLLAPFGSAATANNRIVVIDIALGAVTFVSGFNPAGILNWAISQYTPELIIGDADSACLYVFDRTPTVGTTSDWRSGWFDAGDRGLRKLAREYALSYESANGDSLFVDFYVDFSSTATWADTVVASVAGAKPYNAAISRDVQGGALSFGFQTPDSGVVVTDFSMDVVTLGRERKQ
jgi:hypothetical protein